MFRGLRNGCVVRARYANINRIFMMGLFDALNPVPSQSQLSIALLDLGYNNICDNSLYMFAIWVLEKDVTIHELKLRNNLLTENALYPLRVLMSRGTTHIDVRGTSTTTRLPRRRCWRTSSS